MFSVKPFRSILDLIKTFPDEQSCIDHLEWLRWDGKIVSPFDSQSKVYKVANNRYKCTATNKYFNVKTGTIFENTKIPLQQWFLAIYLFTVHKRGISSYQLATDLSITQKTAWFLLSRIRYAMEHESFLKEMEGTVQVDETFVGGKNKNRHWDKKVENSQGRSFKDKTPVFGAIMPNEYTEKETKDGTIKKIVSVPSRVRCTVVPDTKAKSIQPLIYKSVKAGSIIVSDEWIAYKGLNKDYDHRIVDHGRKEYVNKNGDTSNAMENFWSHFKRSIIGVYYHVSRKHLQQYANELVFRFNLRGNTVNENFNLLLQTANTKRLTYRQLIQK